MPTATASTAQSSAQVSNRRVYLLGGHSIAGKQ
jgi:hypothetical protein